jgi:hypothetical protein
MIRQETMTYFVISPLQVSFISVTCSRTRSKCPTSERSKIKRIDYLSRLFLTAIYFSSISGSALVMRAKGKGVEVFTRGEEPPLCFT